MASPYRKIVHRVKESWSIQEIADLYITRNFSMDLVSYVTGIPLATLSRILWYYHLPDMKQTYYTEAFIGEIRRITKELRTEFFWEEREHKANSVAGQKTTMETDFFSEIS